MNLCSYPQLWIYVCSLARDQTSSKMWLSLFFGGWSLNLQQSLPAKVDNQLATVLANSWQLAHTAFTGLGMTRDWDTWEWDQPIVMWPAQSHVTSSQSHVTSPKSRDQLKVTWPAQSHVTSSKSCDQTSTWFGIRPHCASGAYPHRYWMIHHFVTAQAITQGCHWKLMQLCSRWLFSQAPRLWNGAWE